MYALHMWCMPNILGSAPVRLAYTTYAQHTILWPKSPKWHYRSFLQSSEAQGSKCNISSYIGLNLKYLIIGMLCSVLMETTHERLIHISLDDWKSFNEIISIPCHPIAQLICDFVLWEIWTLERFRTHVHRKLVLPCIMV